MPVVVGWIDHQESIALIDYQGHWSWDEATQANKRLASMIAAKNYRCDVIGNFRDGTMKTVVPAISNGRKFITSLPPNVGLVVVITNPLIDMLVSALKSFDPNLNNILRSVSTMEQAQSLIQQRRTARY